MANKIQAEGISAISGQKHWRVRAGLSKLQSNAVANQEATCWKSDARNGGTANSQSLRVTVWCEKQWLHLPLHICIRKLVHMRNELINRFKPLRFGGFGESCRASFWSKNGSSSNPHSKLVKQVVFLSSSLSSSPMNEKIKIEAWRD